MTAVDEQPLGYPRLAAYLATTPDYLFFQSSGYLKARLILEQQEALRRLEDEVDQRDKADNEIGPEGENCLRNLSVDKERQDIQAPSYCTQHELKRTRNHPLPIPPP